MSEGELVELIKRSFPDVEARIQRRQRVWIDAPSEKLLDIAKWLSEQGFRTAVSVTCAEEAGSFSVTYHLWSFDSKILVSLRTRVPHDKPVLPSLASIFPSAELHEREVYTMLGVSFEGHPRLDPILLPEDWPGGYPLRKDFRLIE